MLSKGDRIRLVKMPQESFPLEEGALGTVTFVKPVNLPGDTWTQVGVDWDNGRSLMLCVPPDVVEKVS